MVPAGVLLQESLDLEIEDLNAFLTRMDAERLLAQLEKRPYKQPSLVSAQLGGQAGWERESLQHRVGADVASASCSRLAKTPSSAAALACCPCAGAAPDAAAANRQGNPHPRLALHCCAAGEVGDWRAATPAVSRVTQLRLWLPANARRRASAALPARRHTQPDTGRRRRPPEE